MYTYIESWRGLANKGSGIAFLWEKLVDVWPPPSSISSRDLPSKQEATRPLKLGLTNKNVELCGIWTPTKYGHNFGHFANHIMD